MDKFEEFSNPDVDYNCYWFLSVALAGSAVVQAHNSFIFTYFFRNVGIFSLGFVALSTNTHELCEKLHEALGYFSLRVRPASSWLASSLS